MVQNLSSLRYSCGSCKTTWSRNYLTGWNEGYFADHPNTEEAELNKLRNALQTLMSDVDHLGHWIPDPCRLLVEDALNKK